MNSKKSRRHKRCRKQSDHLGNTNLVMASVIYKVQTHFLMEQTHDYGKMYLEAPDYSSISCRLFKYFM